MNLLRFPSRRAAAAALVTLAMAHLGCVETVYVREAPPPAPLPPPPPPAPAQVVVADDGAVDDFYEPLSYYGVWIDGTPYGRVWQPAPDMAGPDFWPYGSDGYWAVNEYGDWVFVSRWHSQWGWATYHYGRWVWSDLYGWVWVPGTRWAPAWVEWRYGGGYVGWAPMGPPGVVIVEQHFVFVERTYIGHQNVYTYRVPAAHRRTAYAAAAPVMGGSVGGQGEAYVKPGPPLSDLRAAGVAVVSAEVRPPEKGYLRTQARLVSDGAAERRASGRVLTAPQVRGGLPSAADGRASSGPMPPSPAPGPGVDNSTYPGARPGAPAPSSPAGRPGAGAQPGVLPSTGARSDAGVQPGVPPSAGARPAPGLPSRTPDLPSARPSTPVQPARPSPQPAPVQPARPSPAPQPPSVTPRPAPGPSATTTARPKPAPRATPKPKKR